MGIVEGHLLAADCAVFFDVIIAEASEMIAESSNFREGVLKDGEIIEISRLKTWAGPSCQAATRQALDVSRGPQTGKETEKQCLRREISEELPKLKLGRVTLWKRVTSTNRRSGRRMSDAIFIANKTAGLLTIGDKREIDRAIWRKPRGVKLTPTSRFIRDKLFPKVR
jgi:8-oxo-dGTP diphosphatase